MCQGQSQCRYDPAASSISSFVSYVVFHAWQRLHGIDTTRACEGDGACPDSARILPVESLDEGETVPFVDMVVSPDRTRCAPRNNLDLCSLYMSCSLFDFPEYLRLHYQSQKSVLLDHRQTRPLHRRRIRQGPGRFDLLRVFGVRVFVHCNEYMSNCLRWVGPDSLTLQ